MLLLNYIKTAWRNILRHKLFSTINILGLAIGLAAVMLITLFVRSELSYDTFWNNVDNIYRIHVRVDVPGKDPEYNNGAAPPFAKAFKKDFPELQNVARMVDMELLLIKDNNNFPLSIALVDAEILKIFEFKTIYGDIAEALNDKSSLILNQSQSIKFFGDKNPIGEIVTVKFFDHTKDYHITAVIEDHVDNTVLAINGMVLVAEEDFEGNIWSTWYSNFAFTYFTIKPNTDIKDITSRFPSFIDRHYPKLPFGGPDLKPRDAVTLSAMHITDLHLKAQGKFILVPKGNLNTVIMFSIVAILILIIASINFMNLSTSRASQRAKEVALRKTMGATRKNLIFQFLGESILITFFSLLIALLLIEILLPLYNHTIGKELIIDYFSMDILYITFFAIFIGIIAGIYPAFILSNFRPALVLSANKSAETNSSIKLRSFLVLLQFTISITLFVATAVIFAQMKFTENMDLGYTKENLLIINGNDYNKLVEKIDIITKRINRLNSVSSTTYSDGFSPGRAFTASDPIRTEQTTEYNPIMITFRPVGYDFLKTYDIPLIAGRSYERDRNDQRATREQIVAGEGHTGGIILNKSAVRRLGLGTAQEAIGKMLYMNVGKVGDDGAQKLLEAEFSVIGVIDDVHFVDLKTQVGPEFYQLMPKRPYFVIVRYSGNPIDIIDGAREIWQQEMPGVSFEYKYAADALGEQYVTEKGQMKMFSAFSALAIFIACLGLFGLANFTAERRTKEIGIRKVMGANTFDIVKLLVWQFTKPVIIASLIAWPLSFYAMSRWLENFVYRIDNIIIIALCLIAGLLALLIAWTTVAGNSYAVARTNPIKALRYE